MRLLEVVRGWGAGEIRAGRGEGKGRGVQGGDVLGCACSTLSGERERLGRLALGTRGSWTKGDDHCIPVSLLRAGCLESWSIDLWSSS